MVIIQRKHLLVPVWLILVSGTIAAIVSYVKGLRCEGDTTALLYEVKGMLTAIQDGQILGWGGKFPLLQKIPATFLILMGYDDTSTLRWLATLSLVSFVGMAVIGWWSLRKQSSRLAVVYVLILASGPLLWHARTSFSESLAAFVVLLFVVACVENAKGWLVFLAFFVASLSKDISSPLLLLLGVAANLVGQDRGFVPPRWKAIAGGFLFALVFQIGFNWVRFRSLVNVPYMVEVELGPTDVMTRLSFGLGVWFSPNGGLALFWPTFFLALVFAAWRVLKDVTSDGLDRAGRIRRSLPLAATGLVLCAMTLGLSRWAAPLGWVCWGPRLILPWIPAAAFLLLAAYSDAYCGFLSHYRRLWSVGVLLAFLTLPQYTILFQDEAMARLFAQDSRYPRVAIVQEDRQYYYEVINYTLWRKKSALLRAYTPGWRPLFLAAAPIGLMLMCLQFAGKGECRLARGGPGGREG